LPAAVGIDLYTRAQVLYLRKHQMARRPSRQPIAVSAAVVGDAYYLVDATTFAGQLGGDLGLEAEALFLNGDALNDLATEEVEIVSHVAQEGEQAIAKAAAELSVD